MSVTDPAEDFLFFAAALAPPTPALARLLQEDADVPGNGEWVCEYARDTELLAAVREEHTRLFVTAFPRLAAPPYVAEFLARDGPEQLLANLSAELDRHGLEIITDQGCRPDHLRLLLEAAGRIVDPDDRKGFVAEWLAPWLSRYLERLRAAAHLPLYPGLVSAAEALATAIINRPANGSLNT